MRPARAADLGFLREMLYEAAHWRPGVDRPALEEALASRELAKLLEGWGERQCDLGVICEDAAGRPIGAAWCRRWTADDHSHGFVAPEIPELAIAVVPAERGRGLGTALLADLLQVALSHGVAQLSLSVERDNPALRLYRRCGFREVATVGNSWTMVARTGVDER